MGIEYSYTQTSSFKAAMVFWSFEGIIDAIRQSDGQLTDTAEAQAACREQHLSRCSVVTVCSHQHSTAPHAICDASCALNPFN